MKPTVIIHESLAFTEQDNKTILSFMIFVSSGFQRKYVTLPMRRMISRNFALGHRSANRWHEAYFKDLDRALFFFRHIASWSERFPQSDHIAKYIQRWIKSERIIERLEK